MTKYLIGALIVLLLALGGLGVLYHNCITEKDRLEDNQSTLLDSITHYKTENGLQAASVAQLTLTKDELEDHYKDLTQRIQDLNVKLSRVNSASSSSIQTEYRVNTVIKDSIIYRDRVLDTCKVFKWMDPWVRLQGRIKNDSVNMDVSSVDTLTTILYRVPKKFWFIRYGTKEIRQVVTSSNPHTRIIYTEYIKMK